MIYASIALFILGASLGLLMLIKYILFKRHIPKGLAIIHGSIVATALILFIANNIMDPANANWVSAGLFVITAGLGAYLFIHDLKTQHVLKIPLVLHILLAISALTTMLLNHLNFIQI